MSCISCLKTYSLLRPEKGCPGCGFSYCSKCIKNKIFLEKVNSEVKVCNKCKNIANSKKNVEIDPPDTYFKRIAAINECCDSNKSHVTEEHPTEREIKNRLEKLKDGNLEHTKNVDKEIADRLKTLKDVPSTSQAELEERLAKLRDVPVSNLQTKPVLIIPETRTEQEQANDLLKQYLENNSIDKKYNDEFEEKVNEIQTRLQNLKGSGVSTQKTTNNTEDSEDEEEIVKIIIEKAKKEAVFDEDFSSATDELPFCEICNEDATMRCCGCKYLFCKRCFMEHRDEDDGCDKYENYIAPKSTKV